MSERDDAIHTYGVTLEAVARLNRIFDRSLRDGCGLSQGWFETLLRIERSGGSMTMGTLAEQIALTTGGVTRLVDRIADAGYVERRPCAEDRRVQYVAITEAGRAKLAAALEIHRADLRREFTGRISEPERELIVEVMERLREPVTEPAHS